MQMTIRYTDDCQGTSCPVCGQRHGGAGGPRLFLEQHAEPVCRTCGKRMAPDLAALVELAHTARRVGRQTRRLLTPPMESLLDLARAAENYTAAEPRLPARVG
jgi:hypothetical protein